MAVGSRWAAGGAGTSGEAGVVVEATEAAVEAVVVTPGAKAA